jgi:uncharacterized protein
MRLRRSCPTYLLLVPSFVLLAFLLPAAAAWAERVEDLPKPTDYVSDYAHALSPETVARLDNLCGQLDHSKTNAQVAIVTLRNLNGDDKADFANRLEEKWKVGKKGSDRGILILVSTEDRHYWIEVGYGLEGILPDGKVGDIGRAMVPYLKTGDYDSGVTTGLLQVANVIAADAKVSLEDAAPEQTPVRAPPHHAISGGAIIFRIILIILVLAFFGIRGLLGFGLGMFFGGGRGGWGGGGGFGGGGDSGGGSGFGGFGGGESGGGGAGGDF